MCGKDNGFFGNGKKKYKKPGQTPENLLFFYAFPREMLLAGMRKAEAC
jgi:hypothetical protein